MTTSLYFLMWFARESINCTYPRIGFWFLRTDLSESLQYLEPNSHDFLQILPGIQLDFMIAGQSTIFLLAKPQWVGETAPLKTAAQVATGALQAAAHRPSTPKPIALSPRLWELKHWWFFKGDWMVIWWESHGWQLLTCWGDIVFKCLGGKTKLSHPWKY